MGFYGLVVQPHRGRCKNSTRSRKNCVDANHYYPLLPAATLLTKILSTMKSLRWYGIKPKATANYRSKTCTNVQLKRDRKSTRLNSSHVAISYAVFCLKKKKRNI